MFKKTISIILIHTFLVTGVVYPEPSDRSLFKGKRPDYKKIQEQRETEIQKTRDVLSGKSESKKSSIYKQDLLHSIKLSSLKELSSIYIPDSLGRVVEAYEDQRPQTADQRPLIVHIQDLHTNPEGQFNEASILEILVKDYKLDLVCSEGAEGEVDTSTISSFPNAEVREKTAKLFVNSGELTAEEYLSITKYPKLPIWGVEDKDIYFQNIIEFNKIMKFSPDSQVFIKQVKDALTELKPKIYSQKLLELDERYNGYEEGKMDTNEYLDFLISLYPDFDKGRFKNISLIREAFLAEKDIDQQKIMQESQDLLLSLQSLLSQKNKTELETLLGKASLFKDQKIAPFSFYSYLDELARKHLKDEIAKYPSIVRFVEYLKNVNSLDSAGLFTEIEELTYEIKDLLSTDENQKHLTKSIRHIRILGDFFNLKLSNEELSYYINNRDECKVGFFEEFLDKNLKKYNIDAFVDFNPDLIDAHLSELEHFYEIAHKRDIAIYNNTIREVQKRNAKVVALMMGGFHTPGVMRLLKENGYSYVVISPYSSTQIDEENYQFLLSGKRKPISELIGESSEKLRVPLANSKEENGKFSKRFLGSTGKGLGVVDNETKIVSQRPKAKQRRRSFITSSLENLLWIALVALTAVSSSSAFSQEYPDTQQVKIKPPADFLKLPAPKKVLPLPDINERFKITGEERRSILEYVNTHSNDPKSFILEKMKEYQALILGEVHTRPWDLNVNLVMLKEIIPELKAIGLSHFVVELDPQIFDEYLKNGTGIFENYSYEWKDLVDSMLKAGIEVIPIFPGEYGDTASMENMKEKIFSKNPEAKVLFYVGAMHARVKKEPKRNLEMFPVEKERKDGEVFWLGRLLKNYLGEENCFSICIKRTGDNQRRWFLREPVFDPLLDVVEGNTSFGIDISNPIFDKVYLDGRMLGMALLGPYRSNYDGFIFLEDPGFDPEQISSRTNYSFIVEFDLQNELGPPVVKLIRYGDFYYYVPIEKATVFEGFDFEPQALGKEPVIRSPSVSEFRNFLSLVEKELENEEGRIHPHSVLVKVYRQILNRFKDMDDEMLRDILKTWEEDKKYVAAVFKKETKEELKQPTIDGKYFNWYADTEKDEKILAPEIASQFGRGGINRFNRLNSSLNLLRSPPENGGALFTLDELTKATQNGFQLHKGDIIGKTSHDNIPGINLALFYSKNYMRISNYTRAFFMSHEFKHALGGEEQEAYEIMVRFLVRHGLKVTEEIRDDIEREVTGVGKTGKNLILELVKDVIGQLEIMQDENAIIANLQHRIKPLIDESHRLAEELGDGALYLAEELKSSMPGGKYGSIREARIDTYLEANYPDTVEEGQVKAMALGSKNFMDEVLKTLDRNINPGRFIHNFISNNIEKADIVWEKDSDFGWRVSYDNDSKKYTIHINEEIINPSTVQAMFKEIKESEYSGYEHYHYTDQQMREIQYLSIGLGLLECAIEISLHRELKIDLYGQERSIQSSDIEKGIVKNLATASFLSQVAVNELYAGVNFYYSQLNKRLQQKGYKDLFTFDWNGVWKDSSRAIMRIPLLSNLEGVDLESLKLDEDRIEKMKQNIGLSRFQEFISLPPVLEDKIYKVVDLEDRCIRYKDIQSGFVSELEVVYDSTQPDGDRFKPIGQESKGLASLLSEALHLAIGLEKRFKKGIWDEATDIYNGWVLEEVGGSTGERYVQKPYTARVLVCRSPNFIVPVASYFDFERRQKCIILNYKVFTELLEDFSLFPNAVKLIVLQELLYLFSMDNLVEDPHIERIKAEDLFTKALIFQKHVNNYRKIEGRRPEDIVNEYLDKQHRDFKDKLHWVFLQGLLNLSWSKSLVGIRQYFDQYCPATEKIYPERLTHKPEDVKKEKVPLPRIYGDEYIKEPPLLIDEFEYYHGFVPRAKCAYSIKPTSLTDLVIFYLNNREIGSFTQSGDPSIKAFSYLLKAAAFRETGMAAISLPPEANEEAPLQRLINEHREVAVSVGAEFEFFNRLGDKSFSWDYHTGKRAFLVPSLLVQKLYKIACLQKGGLDVQWYETGYDGLIEINSDPAACWKTINGLIDFLIEDQSILTSPHFYPMHVNFGVSEENMKLLADHMDELKAILIGPLAFLSVTSLRFEAPYFFDPFLENLESTPSGEIRTWGQRNMRNIGDFIPHARLHMTLPVLDPTDPLSWQMPLQLQYFLMAYIAYLRLQYSKSLKIDVTAFEHKLAEVYADYKTQITDLLAKYPEYNSEAFSITNVGSYRVLNEPTYSHRLRTREKRQGSDIGKSLLNIWNKTYTNIELILGDIKPMDTKTFAPASKKALHYSGLKDTFKEEYEVTLNLSKSKTQRFQALSGDKREAMELAMFLNNSLSDLETILKRDPELKAYLDAVLSKPDNRGPPILIRISDKLPVNSVRYFNKTANQVETIFNETFIKELLAAKDTHPKAVRLILAERLFHELGHDNKIESTVKERAEERDLILKDLALHQVLQKQGLQPQIDTYFAQAKPTFQSGYYFKAFIQDQLMPVIDQPNELQARIEGYLDKNYPAESDLKAFASVDASKDTRILFDRKKSRKSILEKHHIGESSARDKLDGHDPYEVDEQDFFNLIANVISQESGQDIKLTTVSSGELSKCIEDMSVEELRSIIENFGLKNIVTPKKVVVYSGPSGVGKGNIWKILSEKYPHLFNKVVLYNSRAPRPGEIDGADYHFRTEDEIMRMEQEGRVMAYRTHGDLHGIPIDELKKAYAGDRIILSENSVDRASMLKDELPGILTVFISPLSKSEIERQTAMGYSFGEIVQHEMIRRHKLRTTKTGGGFLTKRTNMRMAKAIEEMQRADEYSQVIVNEWGDIEGTVQQFEEAIFRHIVSLIFQKDREATQRQGTLSTIVIAKDTDLETREQLLAQLKDDFDIVTQVNIVDPETIRKSLEEKAKEEALASQRFVELLQYFNGDRELAIKTIEGWGKRLGKSFAEMVNFTEYTHILDADGNPTDKIKPYDLVHQDGDNHETALVLAVNRDGKVLVIKRAEVRGRFPGKLGVSASGHLGFKTDMIKGALEKLDTKLGIVADAKDLILIGKPRSIHRITHNPKTKLKDTESSTLFLYFIDDPSQVVPNIVEIESFRFMGVEELVEDLQNHPENYEWNGNLTALGYILKHKEIIDEINACMAISPVIHDFLKRDIGVYGNQKNIHDDFHNVEVNIRSAERRLVEKNKRLIERAKKEGMGEDIYKEVVRNDKDLQIVRAAKRRFIESGCHLRHLHCKAGIDDGEKTPEELVDLAIANGVTELYISSHYTLDGFIRAKEYLRTKYPDHILELRPAVEITMPTDTGNEKLDWKVIIPDDPAVFSKLQDLLKEMLGINNEVFTVLFNEMINIGKDPDRVREMVLAKYDSIVSKVKGLLDRPGRVKQEIEIDYEPEAFVRQYQDIFKRLAEAGLRPESIFNIGEVMGAWLYNKGGLHPDEVRMLRAFLFAHFDVSHAEDIAGRKIYRARQAAERVKKLGGLFVKAHISKDIMTKGHSFNMLTRYISSLLKDGLIDGIESSDDVKGSDEVDVEVVDAVRKLTGKAIRLERASNDFHRGDVRNLVNVQHDPESYFDDGARLARPYIDNIKRLIGRKEYFETLDLIDNVLENVNQYDEETRELKITVLTRLKDLKIALEAALNTKKALKSQPNPKSLSDYIKFLERFGADAENEPRYLNYLKALNRYEDLDWTKKYAPLVKDRTVVVGQVEMGLSKALLENLYKKFTEEGYSPEEAEVKVGELSQLTMAGGLGNIKRDLVESWVEKGLDLVSMNIFYGEWIQGVGKEDSIKGSMKYLLEILGKPEMEFEVEIFDKKDIKHNIKTKVSIYRDPFSPFPNYWIYCPDVFDGLYPEGRWDLAQQLVLYRKASLKLLEELHKQGKIKDRLLFSLSEGYTATLVPQAIDDEYAKSSVFKDIFIHHYNHTKVPSGRAWLTADLYDTVGFRRDRYGDSIIEGDKLNLVKLICKEADIISGCSMEHTDILREEVLKDFAEKIPDNISEENSEGAYLDNWQGEAVQKVIAKYYVKLGARDDNDLFERLDKAPDMREAFIDELMEAKKKQKDGSMEWFTKQGMKLDSDLAFISLTRRMVQYKRMDILVNILKDQGYRERFMKLGIAIIVGGREFEAFSKEQTGILRQLLRDHPELEKYIAILPEDIDHAGYNIFTAPKIYTAVDATIMLSDRGQEAGPTSPSKGLNNGAAIIAVKDGVIPELLEQFDGATLEGNGFEVGYNADGSPSIESLFKALEGFSSAYKDEQSRRALAYNSLKTGMLKSNISTRQGPGLIDIWQGGLERKDKLAKHTETRRILLVDDKELHRTMYSLHLKKAGYKVIAVPSLSKALDHLHDVDVVVSDLSLIGPDDGITLAEEFKKRDFKGPIIVQTASELRQLSVKDRERANAAKEKGIIVDIITKSPEGLLNVVAELTKETLHASWLLVERLSPETYSETDLIIPDSKTGIKNRAELSFINLLRDNSRARTAKPGQIIELEGYDFKVMEINRQKILVSNDIINTLSDGEIGALLSKAISSIGFRPIQDGGPLIISSLSRSPHLFEDCQQNGFIGINNAFLELYRQANQADANPLEKQYLKILLQIGLEHELKHEDGERDEDIIVNTDIRRMIELCKEYKVDINKFIKFLYGKGIIDDDFMIRLNAEQIDKLSNLLLYLNEERSAFDFNKIDRQFIALDEALGAENLEVFKLVIDGLGLSEKIRIAYNINRLKKRGVNLFDLEQLFQMPEFYKNSILADLDIIPYMRSYGFIDDEIMLEDFGEYELISGPFKEGDTGIFIFKKGKEEHVVRFRATEDFQDFSFGLEKIDAALKYTIGNEVNTYLNMILVGYSDLKEGKNIKGARRLIDTDFNKIRQFIERLKDEDVYLELEEIPGGYSRYILKDAEKASKDTLQLNNDLLERRKNSARLWAETRGSLILGYLEIVEDNLDLLETREPSSDDYREGLTKVGFYLNEILKESDLQEKFELLSGTDSVTLGKLPVKEILNLIQNPKTSENALQDEAYKAPSQLYKEVKEISNTDAANTTESKRASIAKSASFVYMLEKDKEKAQKATELLLSMPTRASPIWKWQNWIHDSEALLMYCQAYDILKNSVFLFENPDIEEKIKKNLEKFASDFYGKAKLLDIIKFSGIGQNNYRLKIASAIGMAGIVLEHSDWIGLAMESIEYVLKKVQATEGGAYAEGPGYLEYSLNSLLPFWVSYYRFSKGGIMEFNGKEYKFPLTEERYKNMIDWLIKIRCPDGTRPNYDDNHVTYSLSGMVAGIYQGGVYSWDWLTSKKDGRYYTGGNLNLAVDLLINFSPDFVPTEPTWAAEDLFMPEEGMSVVRSGWGPEDFYLLTLGEHGRVRKASGMHEHCDEGSFILYFNGERLIIDSGYGNFKESRKKKMYAGERHSSTPLVDGKGSYEVGWLLGKLKLGVLKDIFKGRGTNASLENFKDCGDLGYYFEVKTRYRKTDFVRRFYVDPKGQILIVDDIDSKSKHEYKMYIHGAGQLDEAKTTYEYDRTRLKVNAIREAIVAKEEVPHAEGWVDGEINKFHDALTFSSKERGDQERFVTLLSMANSGEELPLVSSEILKGIDFNKVEDILKALSGGRIKSSLHSFIKEIRDLLKGGEKADCEEHVRRLKETLERHGFTCKVMGDRAIRVKGDHKVAGHYWLIVNNAYIVDPFPEGAEKESAIRPLIGESGGVVIDKDNPGVPEIYKKGVEIDLTEVIKTKTGEVITFDSTSVVQDKGEIGMPGSKERGKFYKGIAENVHAYLKDTGMLCKWHSAVIVEKLFKEYGIRSVIMEKNFPDGGAHYWVETEDGFIIDAFTLGHGLDLRRKAEELTRDVDILVLNKNTKDRLEQEIIENFYRNAILYHELTQELYDGVKSAVEAANIIKKASLKDRGRSLDDVYISEEYRNELVGTFFKGKMGEILRFQFDDEGRVSGVSLWKKEGDKVEFLKPDDFKDSHKDLYDNLEFFKQKAEEARSLGLSLILDIKHGDLKDKNVIKDIWFVVKADKSLKEDNPYFEYEDVRLYGTNFGKIPILPLRLLKGNFRRKGFSDVESDLIFQQALMHEMNAIYNGYYSLMNAEESHYSSKELEKILTLYAIGNNTVDRSRYMEEGFLHSILDEFIKRYGVSGFTFPQGIKRVEFNENGRLFVEGTDDEYNVGFNVSFKEEYSYGSRRIIKLNVGTRQFELEGPLYGHEILDGKKETLNAKVAMYLSLLYTILDAEIEKVKRLKPDYQFIRNDNVRANISCGFDYTDSPVAMIHVKLFHENEKMDEFVVCSFIEGEEIYRQPAGVTIFGSLHEMKGGYDGLAYLASILAAFRQDENLPRIIDSPSLLEERTVMPLRVFRPKKDYALGVLEDRELTNEIKKETLHNYIKTVRTQIKEGDESEDCVKRLKELLEANGFNCVVMGHKLDPDENIVDQYWLLVNDRWVVDAYPEGIRDIAHESLVGESGGIVWDLIKDGIPDVYQQAERVDLPLPIIDYDENVSNNARVLFDRALEDKKFVEPIFKKLGITKEDILGIKISKADKKGKDRVLYKLVLRVIQKDKEVERFIALKTLGIDQEPSFLATLSLIKQIARDNTEILNYPTGKKYIPFHYAHRRYDYNIEGIEVPTWYTQNEELQKLGYWIFVDEWEDAPLLSGPKSVSGDELEEFIQKVVTVYCDGLSETPIWSSVDFGEDDIAVKEMRNGRLIPKFLDVGWGRASTIKQNRPEGLHESLLSLFIHYVIGEYLNSNQFFEALKKSKLGTRRHIKEIISLIERDRKILLEDLYFSNAVEDFEKGLKGLLLTNPLIPPSQKSQIKLVMFDVGNVLFKVDFHRSVERLKEFCPDLKRAGKEIDRFIFNLFNDREYETLGYKLETGQITAQEFFENIRNALRKEDFTIEATDEQFIDAWNVAYIGPIKENIDLLKNFKKKGYSIRILSNNNSIHKELVLSLLNEEGIDFPPEHFISSHEIGKLKKDSDMLKEVLDTRLSGFTADSILFVDDLIDNVRSADFAGLRAVLYSPDSRYIEKIRTILFALQGQTKLIQDIQDAIDATEFKGKLILFGSYAHCEQDYNVRDGLKDSDLDLSVELVNTSEEEWKNIWPRIESILVDKDYNLEHPLFDMSEKFFIRATAQKDLIPSGKYMFVITKDGVRKVDRDKEADRLFIKGDLEIGQPVEIVDGVNKVEIVFKKKRRTSERFAKGRAVVLDPKKVVIEQEDFEKCREFNFRRYAVSSQDPGVLSGTKEFRRFPGLTFKEYLEDVSKDKDIIMVSNSLQSGFWSRSDFLIIDGELKMKPEGACGLFEEEFTPQEGLFWVFSFDEENVGVREVELENGELRYGGPRILNGIAGLPLVMDGVDVSSRIESGRPAIKGNQQVWEDPQGHKAAMSALGKDKEGNIVFIHMVGDPDVQEEMMFSEIAQTMIELGVVEAIALGTSADVNQYIKGDGKSYLASKSRRGSMTGSDRPLGAFIKVRSRADFLSYDSSININTRKLLDNALKDERFGGEILKKLKISREDIYNMQIIDTELQGANKKVYKLIIIDNKGNKYEIALRTLGIDHRPIFMDGLSIIESVVSDNEELLNFPSGSQHVPSRYSHICYAIGEIPGLVTPIWHTNYPQYKNVGYWLFADEWIEGPTLEKLQNQVTPEEFIGLIKDVITTYCNGLNETPLWAAVDRGLDDIALSDKYNGRPMFFDIEFTRESRINSTKKQEIHEAVLDFYGDYVYKNNYCSREDFFDALLSSQLRQRIPELIKLLDRDNKYLSGHYMYEDFIKEFMEGLKKATKGLDRFKKSVYSVVNVNRRNLVLLEEILKEDAHSTLPLTDLSHHIRKGTIRIIAIKDPNGSKFIAYRTYFKEGKGIYVDRTFIRHEYRQKGLLLLLNEYCMEHFDYIRIHVLPDELRDKAISRQAHKKIEKMKKQYKMLGFTEESNGLVWRKQGGGKKAFFSKTLQDIRSIYSNL